MGGALPFLTTSLNILSLSQSTETTTHNNNHTHSIHKPTDFSPNTRRFVKFRMLNIHPLETWTQNHAHHPPRQDSLMNELGKTTKVSAHHTPHYILPIHILTL